MKISEVVPGLYWCKFRLVNAYILVSDGEAVLVDTGFPADGATLKSAAETQGTLKGIIVTHAHGDHSGGLAELASDVPVWAHANEAPMLARGACNRPELRPRNGWIRAALVFAKLIASIPEKVAARAPDHIVVSGATIDLLGGIEVLELQGHSAGQIGLRWTTPEGKRVLIAADAVMNQRGLGEPFLYEDKRAGHASIRALARLAEEADVMVFGHGKPLMEPGDAMQSFSKQL